MQFPPTRHTPSPSRKPIVANRGCGVVKSNTPMHCMRRCRRSLNATFTRRTSNDQWSDTHPMNDAAKAAVVGYLSETHWRVMTLLRAAGQLSGEAIVPSPRTWNSFSISLLSVGPQPKTAKLKCQMSLFEREVVLKFQNQNPKRARLVLLDSTCFAVCCSTQPKTLVYYKDRPVISLLSLTEFD